MRKITSIRELGLSGCVSINDYSNIPKLTGVYIFRDSFGEPIYIGKAKNLKNRIMSYSKNTNYKRISLMLCKANTTEYIVTSSEAEALILECNLIKHYKPKYNITLRDDKRYPYLCITNEEFPRIFITRRINPMIGSYLGPYIDADALRKTITILQSIFKIRVCRQRLRESEKGKGPCLYYHIGRCRAPCQGYISKNEYNMDILQAKEVLKGRGKKYLKKLKRELKNAVRELEFERASTIRTDIDAFEKLLYEQRVEMEGGDEDVIAIVCEGGIGVAVIFKIRGGKLIGRDVFSFSSEGDIEEDEAVISVVNQIYSQAPVHPRRIAINNLPEDVESVERMIGEISGRGVKIWSPKKGKIKRILDMALNNARLILREEELKQKQRLYIDAHIELSNLLSFVRPCYTVDGIDISFLSKSGRVGSSVRFELGRPIKKFYRRYIIRGEVYDDVSMMVEVISRKIARREIPDILLLDGGKGQLCRVFNLFSDSKIKPDLIAIAKGTPDKFYIIREGKPIDIKVSDNLRSLLVMIRDEAHRFSRSYQLKKRHFDSSLLDNIDGIGKKRKMRILKLISDVGLEGITEEKILSIKGISDKKTKEIMSIIRRNEKY